MTEMAAGSCHRCTMILVSLLMLISLSCQTVDSTADPLPATPAVTSKRKASLLFSGEVNTVSEPLPPDTTSDELTAFLLRHESRNVFAAGGGATDSVRELEITPAWRSMWKKACHSWYGSIHLPSQGDTLLSCDTYSYFPGLEVCTTVISGIKLLPRQHQHTRGHARQQHNNLPSYCFLVIGQKQSAKGLPPVVWIFKQLMGIKKEDDDGDKASSSSSASSNRDVSSLSSWEPMGPVKSTVSVQRRKEDGRWCFRLDSDIKIKVEFPAMLLKILPTSKAKVEAQGSTSITKTVSKASRLGVEAAYQAFTDFQQERRKRHK